LFEGLEGKALEDSIAFGVTAISRAWSYYRLHGVSALTGRVGEALRRAAYAGEHVLFSCALPVGAPVQKRSFPGSFESKASAGEIAPADLERITSHWNPQENRRLMDQRFAAKARLWLARWEGLVAGYGWTLKGATISPHFYALTLGEVHLFDFFVFPEFRGRGINPVLVEYILSKLGEEGASKAYIECAAWNKAQLASLKKTSFQRMGAARKFCFGGRVFVQWTEKRIEEQ
jgi:GNAT superfamily N-acetyltransferase